MHGVAASVQMPAHQSIGGGGAARSQLHKKGRGTPNETHTGLTEIVPRLRGCDDSACAGARRAIESRLSQSSLEQVRQSCSDRIPAAAETHRPSETQDCCSIKHVSETLKQMTRMRQQRA